MGLPMAAARTSASCRPQATSQSVTTSREQVFGLDRSKAQHRSLKYRNGDTPVHLGPGHITRAHRGFTTDCDRFETFKHGQDYSDTAALILPSPPHRSAQSQRDPCQIVRALDSPCQQLQQPLAEWTSAKSLEQ